MDDDWAPLFSCPHSWARLSLCACVVLDTIRPYRSRSPGTGSISVLSTRVGEDIEHRHRCDGGSAVLRNTRGVLGSRNDRVAWRRALRGRGVRDIGTTLQPREVCPSALRSMSNTVHVIDAGFSAGTLGCAP